MVLVSLQMHPTVVDTNSFTLKVCLRNNHPGTISINFLVYLDLYSLEKFSSLEEMLGSSCFYFHSAHHRHEAEAVRSESHCLLLHDEWVCKSFHASIASTLHNLNMYELIHIHTVTYSMISNREPCALYGECNIAVAICEATSKLCSILHVFNVPML